MKRTRFAPALLLVASVLVASCGGGSTGPAAGSASPTSPASSASASSTAPSTPSASPTQSATDDYMSSDEVATALLPKKSMPGAKRTDSGREDFPYVSPTAGYAEAWLTFVSGSGACRALLEGHPFTPGSSATQTLVSSHLRALQMISSMQSEADAKALMAQNVAQIAQCRKFKARFEGRTYTFEHAGKVAKQSLDGEQTVTHRITADLGDGRIILWMMESRLGGEVMFLNLNPTDPTGAEQYTMVAFLAAAKFADTVTDYRATHPRTV